MRWTIISIPMLLAACSAPELEPVDGYPGGNTTGGTCRNADFSRFVGKAGTNALAAEARAVAGASTVRWLRPGQVVTMEFRDDRLNIELDAGNRVVALRCG